MKKATQITVNQMSVKTALLFVCFLLLCSVKMSAQTATTIAATIADTEVTTAGTDATMATASNNNTSMNMVSWFMGTKQTPKANISSDVNVSSKRQMINAGVQPNRLLIKAFLKKASNYQSTVA